MNRKNNKLDQHFKDAFDQFKAEPPQFDAKKIEEKKQADFDARFRKKMSSLQVSPQPQVWKKIQNSLPLHPALRRYINWMTKIAAILVVGMLCSIFYEQQQKIIASTNNTVPNLIAATIPVETILEEDENAGAFVFEVEKKGTSNNHPRKYNKKEEEEIKNMLQFILDDSDDIAKLVDQQIIKESLKPAIAPSETVVLVIPENDEPPTNTATTELRFDIKIPLIIVESDQEASNLIQIYESSHKAPDTRSEVY